MAGREHAVSWNVAPLLLAVGAFVIGLLHARAADPPDMSGQFTPEQLSFYEQQVLPILSENCYKCHSHEADKIKGGFVLDSREGLLKGGETGPAIVPGDS